MTKELLNHDEVSRLLSLLDNLFDIHDEHRAGDALGQLIQYPKIPAILSESAVAWLISEGRVPGLVGTARASTTGGDLDLIGPDGAVYKIEVKATGRSAFQYFSQKDIDADYLIWLHFGNFFHDKQRGTGDLLVIRNADSVLDGPRKITLGALRQIPGLDVQAHEIDLVNLFPVGDS